MLRKLIILFLGFLLIYCSQGSAPNNSEKTLILNWQNKFNMAWGIWTPPTIFNDSLLVTTGDIYLTCFRITDGTQKWRMQISDDLTLQSRYIVQNNDYLLATHKEDVRAWDIESGAEVWRLPLIDDSRDLVSSYISTFGDYVFIAGNSQIKSIKLFGDIRFTKSLYGHTNSAIYNNNKLYCGTSWWLKTSDGVKVFGRITCLNAENGDSLWAFDAEQGWFAGMPPITEEGVVYCGTIEGPSDFYAIDAETGEQIWKHEGLPGYSALLVDDILYVNSGSNIHALDKTNGNEIWEAHVNTISLGPKFTYYDGYIYYVGASELNIINAETGEIEHQMYAKDSTAFWYVTAGAGKVFLQSAEHIYCYEPWKKDD